MTTPNPEDTPLIDPPAAEQPVTSPVLQAAPQGLDSRRRLRELLSVPERDRSDEQWDEIIELEIQLAPGNRLAAGQDHGSVGGHPGTGPSRPSGPGGQPQKKHRPRSNNNNRRPRTNKPSGTAG